MGILKQYIDVKFEFNLLLLTSDYIVHILSDRFFILLFILLHFNNIFKNVSKKN